jgi:hypothetical protein
VAFPITIKNSDAGGCSDMERVVWDFVRTKDMVVNLKMKKLPARSVASICKDHHYGIEVPLQASRRPLIPLVNETFKGVYHGYGLHPGTSPRLLCLCCACVGRNPAGASGDFRPRKYSVCMILVIPSLKVLQKNYVQKLSSLIMYPRSKFYLAPRTQF